VDRSKIKAVLCDIGGVLYIEDKAVPGAVDAVKRIKEHYPMRFLSNTTQVRARQIVETLQDFGFDIKKEEIITALDTTKAFLQKEKSSAYYLLTDDAKSLFDDIKDLPCRYVVVGDAQENFSYEHMNKAFRLLQDGASLLAIAKNRYFKSSDGKLSLDTGAFVSALEFSSGKEAHVIGKPSKKFYHKACKLLGVLPEEALMIGDDIVSDIRGAHDAGLKTALVRTGKSSDDDLKKGIQPDLIIDSIDDFL
jgi:HAD superfamily hydrolase (TIGR01458 family)